MRLTAEVAAQFRNAAGRLMVKALDRLIGRNMLEEIDGEA